MNIPSSNNPPSVSLHRQVRRAANDILDMEGAHNRLTLILALAIAIGLGFAVPFILDCLWLVSAIFGGDAGKILETSQQIILYSSLLLLAMPLFLAVYRMAVLMTEASQSLRPDTLMTQKIQLHEILYPFTSPKAYARTLLAGLQVCLRWGGIILLPIGFFQLSKALWIPASPKSLTPVSFALGAIAVALGIGWCMVTCRSWGFAHDVFAHPDMTISQICKARRRVKRPLGISLGKIAVTVIRLILGALPVCIPLLLHTLPSLMLSSAVWGKISFDTVQAQAQAQAQEP